MSPLSSRLATKLRSPYASFWGGQQLTPERRFVNHTLANLDGDVDWNPIGFKHPDAKMQGVRPPSRPLHLEQI